MQHQPYGRPAVTLDDLCLHYHLPLAVAASSLGVGSTALKLLCRKHGVARWPYRKISSIIRRLAKVNESLQSTGPKRRTYLLLQKKKNEEALAVFFPESSKALERLLAFKDTLKRPRPHFHNAPQQLGQPPVPRYDDPSWPPQATYPNWQHPSPPNHSPPGSISMPSSHPPSSSYSPQVGWNYPFLTPPVAAPTYSSLPQHPNRPPSTYPAPMRTSLSNSTSSPLELSSSVPSWQYSFPQGLNSYNGYSPPPPTTALSSAPSASRPTFPRTAGSPPSQPPSAPPAPYNLHLSTSSPSYPPPSADYPRGSFHYYPPRPQLVASPHLGMSTSLTSASGLEGNTPSSSPSSNLSSGSSASRFVTIPGVPAQATI